MRRRWASHPWYADAEKRAAVRKRIGGQLGTSELAQLAAPSCADCGEGMRWNTRLKRHVCDQCSHE